MNEAKAKQDKDKSSASSSTPNKNASQGQAKSKAPATATTTAKAKASDKETKQSPGASTSSLSSRQAAREASKAHYANAPVDPEKEKLLKKGIQERKKTAVPEAETEAEAHALKEAEEKAKKEAEEAEKVLQDELRLEAQVMKGKKREKEAGNIDQLWYSRRVMLSIAPLRFLMLAFIRFPFKVRRKVEGDKDLFGKPAVPGMWQFYFTWTNPFVPCYLAETIITGILGIIYFINFFGNQTDSPKMVDNVTDYYSGPSQVLRAEEAYIVARNVIPFTLVAIAIFNGTVGAILLFTRRDLICVFLNLILEAAEKTKINFAHGVIQFMWVFVSTYILSLLLIFVCTVLAFAPITGGLQTMLVTMTYRLFYPPIHAIHHIAFTSLKFAHGLSYYFIMVNSKVFITLFMWSCLLVQNGFIVWNYRLDRVLIRDEKELSYSQRDANRTLFHHLFTDHVLLLDLINGIDRIFAGTAETYYATESVAVCLELYYIFHSQTSPVDFEGERKRDSVVMLIFTLQSAAFLFYSIYGAANINDEALEGLEIIRRRGFMGKKTEDELYFMMSMYVSYTGHFDITVVCANYVTMDKTFVLMLGNTITMFMMMVTQLSPMLTLKNRPMLLVLEQNARITPIKNPKPYSALLWQTESLSSFAQLSHC